MSELLWVPVSIVLLFALVYLLARAPKSEADAGAAAGASKEAHDDVDAGAARETADAPEAASSASGKSSGKVAANGKSSDGKIAADNQSSESTSAAKASLPPVTPPRIEYEEDDEVDPTRVGLATRGARRPSIQPPTQRIVYDEDAATDEPTHAGALILVTARAQTDKGRRRKRNEDSMLVLEENAVYVVADGMGGYHGGDIASNLAVETLQRAFATQTFEGLVHETIPRRASELARAIQMANDVILDRAEADRELAGMGTTICAAYFSPNKQRMYIGHVGDSRMYRLRAGKLRQMTSDHTMKDLGITGAGSEHLSRAVGIWPAVPIDIILGKPQPGDLYLICSDGLTKMVDDDGIASLLDAPGLPQELVDRLVDAANAKGGKDNISVIAIRVDDPLRPFVAAS
jgi:protein phosphatase